MTPGERTPPGGSPSSGKAVALTLRAPCLSVSSFGTTFPSPAPRPRGPQMQPRECRRGCPQLSGSLGARSRRGSRTLAPRFRFRSALGTTPPGAEPLRSRPPGSPAPGPAAPAPGTHPPPGTCWPPWPFPPPPPAAQRGPGGSGGQSSARGEARSAGLALHGSLGRAHAAGTSAASAVAVHPGPRCRRGCHRLTPGTPRPAPVSSAPSGTSSAPDGPEPGSGVPHPLKAPADVGLCRRRRRLALPASGFASFRNTFGRSGEQGPALGSGRRERPHRSATSGSGSAPSGQPRPRARLFPLQLGPASDAGRS